MRIRAVFFDVGETLIDETRMLHGWADHMGVGRAQFIAELDDVIARREHIRSVFKRLNPDYDVAAAAAERRQSGTAFRIEAQDLYHDARQCLSELREKGFFIGIAGNQPASAKATLLSFGLDADVITTSAELGVDKPAPEFFQRILELSGTTAAETLYVGDRVDNDVVPAHTFGMKTALLERGPWGRSQASWPEADRADLRVKALTEIAGLIQSLD
jgi:HAD superfamily hydrolase (TIGR01549 family)